jgi:MraZ protein
MLLGSFKYSMDSKGRVAIPAKLRKAVSPEANETFVMVRGLVKCIDVYPLDLWNELVLKRVEKLDNFNSKADTFIRLLVTKSAVVSLDSQSRLLIPKTLIEYAGIENEVLILGAIRKIELWNPEIYEQYISENEAMYEQIANEVMNAQKNDVS